MGKVSFHESSCLLKVAQLPVFKPRPYDYESEIPPVTDLILHKWTGKAQRKLKSVFSLILEFRNVYCNNDNFILSKQLMS